MNIVLDYGHGGIDSYGKYTTAPHKMFTYPTGEVAYEGFFNRQIGGLVEIYLRSHYPQYNVITTVKATDYRDVHLSYRVKVANEFNPEETIFISLHSNASFEHTARGFEIYTTKGITKSDGLATCIGDSVKKYYDEMGLRVRQDYISDGDIDKELDFYVLRKTRCPAVLIEALFFDCWDDYIILKDPAYQKEFAWNVYLGIIKYLNNL
ncbi:N-acetylmuramoyl-L-alanine amidase family protein [Chondrinema litorale]|uniref:N-acetylmuramoyl-L-alanine amidase family protein n=1 Tax=Chondrinema litorale TaxID=2994555 RepID=UPI000C60C095|nr:N-acetylmuramoyl-L-alanine amidase [Chondrinema litorale]MBT28054.1 N-acetylmuramoyl-L-alanine amidase [Thalassovita sp.]UZR97362.1 N-acetylmuramoyl-L-alanine amidase [Chondrinema litorale]